MTYLSSDPVDPAIEKLKADAMDMYGEALKRDGRYLLLRRFKGIGSPELNAKYAAAEWLVSYGYARWLTGDMAPGISLTGKPPR